MNETNGRLTDVAGIILAGGRNSRMGGRDKAFLLVDGETVLQRSLRVLNDCFSQVLVVSNQPEKYAHLDVRVTPDEMPDVGPLGGLHAGLGQIDAPYAFVTACDMPFLRAGTIRFMVGRLRSGERCDAVVPRWDDDIEPLHGLYATRLRGEIATAVAEGARSMRDFLPRIATDYVPQATMEKVPGAEESFRNINTPEEAARFSIELVG